jgi:hypothetical protein
LKGFRLKTKQGSFLYSLKEPPCLFVEKTLQAPLTKKHPLAWELLHDLLQDDLRDAVELGFRVLIVRFQEKQEQIVVTFDSAGKVTRDSQLNVISSGCNAYGVLHYHWACNAEDPTQFTRVLKCN